MSVLSSNSLKIGVQEQLPFKLDYTVPAANSVIQDRKMLYAYPISGQYFGTTQLAGGNRTAKFSMNSAKLIDGHTVRLNFFHRVTSANNDGLVSSDCVVMPDDFIQSVIKKVVVRLGGKVIEEIDNYGLIWNYLSYATMPESYCKKQATLEGCYRNFCTFNGAGVWQTGDYNPQAAAIVGRHYSIPLQIGLFRLPTFLPPLLDLQIEVEFDTFASSHVVITAGTTPAVNYVLTNMHITYDEVTPIESYNDAYRQAITMGDGVTLAFESYSNALATLQSINANLKFTAGFQDLRTIHALFRRSDEEENSGTFSKSMFRRANIKSWQVKIGNMSFPAQNPCDTDVDMYNHLQMSMAQLGSIDAGGLITYQNFADADNSKLDTTYAVTADSGAIGAVSNIGPADVTVLSKPLAGMYSLSLNLERSLESVWSGIATRDQGYTIDVYLRNRLPNSTTINIPAGTPPAPNWTITRKSMLGDPTEFADDNVNDVYNPDSTKTPLATAYTPNKSYVGAYRVDLFLHHQRSITIREGRVEEVVY